MPGAFNGTASSTISQMEKMLTVFSPLYEKCFPRRWDISGWYRDDRECRTLRGVVGRKSSAKVQFSAATFECAKLSGPGRTVSGSKQNPSFSKLRVAALVINSADPLFGSQPPAKRPSTSPRGLRGAVLAARQATARVTVPSSSFSGFPTSRRGPECKSEFRTR
jgi:hypothetical protein